MTAPLSDVPDVPAARRRLLATLPLRIDWTEGELLAASGLGRTVLRALIDRFVSEGQLRRLRPFPGGPAGVRYRVAVSLANRPGAEEPSDVDRRRVLDSLRIAPDTAAGLARRLDLHVTTVRRVLDALQQHRHVTANFVGLLAVYRYRSVPASLA